MSVSWNLELLLPDVLLLKFSLSDTTAEHTTQLSGLVHQIPSLMLLICSADGTLASRVKASQLGNYPFFYHPSAMGIAKGIEALRAKRGNAALEHAPQRPYKILVVDDDPQILVALRTRLEAEGFEMIELSQSFQFWKILQEVDPDLLLLDISMPDFSGIELCQAVRQAPFWSDLPIVFFTSHADARVQQAAFRAGANDLIEKSSPHSDLLIHLYDQLKRSHLHQAMAAIDNSTISFSP